MDDLRIGRILRALRRRLHWRQSDLGRRTHLSQSMVSLVERGRVEGLSLRAIRRLFAALDADVVMVIRWRAGDLDRLLDERHARLGAWMVRDLEDAGWVVVPEVTFSIFGERGSIDLLAWHARTRTLLVIELKSELTSVEETLRRHDVKMRLASRIALERFRWQAAIVGRLLVLPDERTARRRVAAHFGVLGRTYPAAPREVRRWLRSPVGQLSGILYLPNIDHSRASRGLGGSRRVRVAAGPRSRA